MTTFAQAQPMYAEHGIATFPVRISDGEKKPAVKNYGRMGLSASSKLVTRFADADAFGFMVGERSSVTILDVDTQDERILSDALNRHGHTPLIVRSGSGKFHAYYRHSGERRSIRPWRGLPIDLLGGGYVVAPPSRSAKGQYEIIQGSLDDLDRLPVMRNVEVKSAKGAKDGERGDKLFNHCLRHARHCDSEEAMIDVAHTFNDNCEPPMDDDRVISTARSAWGYQERGENWYGRGGIVPLSFMTMDRIFDLSDSAQVLFMRLKRHNNDRGTFVVANAMAESLGWGIDRFRAARRELVEGGMLRVVKRGGRFKHDPYLFGWGE